MPACPTQPRGKGGAAPAKGESLPCQAWELPETQPCVHLSARRLHRHRAVTRVACKAKLAGGGFFSGFLLGVEAKKEEFSLPVLPLPS